MLQVLVGLVVICKMPVPDRNLLDLRDVMLLVGPYLRAVLGLFMHDPHAFELAVLHLQLAKLLRQRCHQLVAVLWLACSLQVINMRGQDYFASGSKQGLIWGMLNRLTRVIRPDMPNEQLLVAQQWAHAKVQQELSENLVPQSWSVF